MNASETKTLETGRLNYALSFKELMVYKKSRLLAREVFNVTKKFPREEAFSLTDQWRRAARSIGAQIAEAWAKRRYPRHFASKLSDADGEQMECQHWTIVAFDDGYIDRETAKRLGALTQEIGRMLGEMMLKTDSFCNDGFREVLKETPSEYSTPNAPDDDLEN